MLHMLTQWRRRGLGIHDFGFLRKEIEALALRRPAKLTQALRRYDAGPALTVGAVRDKAGSFVDFA